MTFTPETEVQLPRSRMALLFMVMLVTAAGNTAMQSVMPSIGTHILTAVAPGTRLSSVTPAEVAGLALDCAEQGLHRHEAVFFGHGVAA